MCYIVTLFIMCLNTALLCAFVYVYVYVYVTLIIFWLIYNYFFLLTLIH